MITPEIDRAANALLDALRQSEAYTRYAALKSSVTADEVNRRLLERFTHAQAALQMAAVAGHEPREEAVNDFERLSALLYQSDELTEYLLAQMSVQRLVAELMERLTQAVGLDVELPEL